MAIVPAGDGLEIEARLSPDKIDQVHAGQKAHVRLSAFNSRTTPELVGVVDLDFSRRCSPSIGLRVL